MSSNKKILYVGRVKVLYFKFIKSNLIKIFAIHLLKGGLADEVDEKTLQSVFIPFGEVMVQMPLDYQSGNLFFYKLMLVLLIFFLSSNCIFITWLE